MNMKIIGYAIGFMLGVVVGLIIVREFLSADLRPVGPPQPTEIVNLGPFEFVHPTDGKLFTITKVTILTSHGWVQECKPDIWEQLQCVNRYDPDEVKRRTELEEGK